MCDKRHHCHSTGKKGADQSCKLNAQKCQISIVSLLFHNTIKNDSHLFIETLKNKNLNGSNLGLLQLLLKTLRLNLWVLEAFGFNRALRSYYGNFDMFSR